MHSLQEFERPKEKIGCSALFVFGVAFLLLVLSCPPLRDGLVRLFTGSNPDWPKADRAVFVMWAEWVRVVLEVVLGFSFSSLVFNKGLQNWSKAYAEATERWFLKHLDEAIGRDPTSSMYRQFRNDLVLALFGNPKDYLSLVDLFKVMRKGYALMDHITSRGINILGMIFWAWVLRSFAGGLHGLIAAYSFLGILLTKILKQLADSPVWPT
jgi:hypothetical protein